MLFGFQYAKLMLVIKFQCSNVLELIVTQTKNDSKKKVNISLFFFFFFYFFF